MLRNRWLRSPGPIAALVLALSSLGCFAHSRGERDWDNMPVVSTGAGATIIYPGQTAPTYIPPGYNPPGSNAGAPQGSGTGAPPPGAPPTSPGAQTQAPPGGQAPATANQTPTSVSPPSYGGASTIKSGPNGEQYSGSPEPGGVPITLIGGAEQQEKGHASWKQDPTWWKYLALPFAAIAAPFKAAADAVRGEPETGPEVPQSAPEVQAPEAHVGAPPPRAPTDYETQMVDRLERELESRQSPTTSGAPRAAPAPLPGYGSASGAATPSIAEELAALQRTPGTAPPPRPPDPQLASRGAPSAPPPRDRVSGPSQAADGIVDRDGDGRIDEWIYRENGEIARVELDETADGLPDRTLHYDLETHQIRRVEEDGNADGVFDSWTDYEDGRVARRRGDGNHDGMVDTWSFYRDGEITRHEQDTTGDGFRDRVGFYEGGKLVREEQDRDGDGRPDATIHYDSRERIVRREEDNDGDGRPDVISYYEAGRLARRELLQHEDPSKTAVP